MLTHQRLRELVVLRRLLPDLLLLRPVPLLLLPALRPRVLCERPCDFSPYWSDTGPRLSLQSSAPFSSDMS